MIEYIAPETGFYYLRHRHYDPATAQFTTPDLLFATTGSRYGYAGNDPVNGTDPLGLFGYGTIAAAFGGIVGGRGPLMNAIGNDIPQWVDANLPAIATGVSIGACVATGGLSCATATVAALGVRVYQRYQDDGGLSASLNADLLETGLTAVTLGIGLGVESGIGGSDTAFPLSQLYGVSAGASGLGIGMFAGDRVSGGDMLERH